MQRDLMIKAVIIGDSGVGKSNIISRYMSGQFGKCQSTIGCQSVIKKLELNGRKIKLMIWDTAGQEKYKSISQAYYRNAAAVILVYDITNTQSFQNMNKWYEELVSNSDPSIIKIIVANKTDLTANRKVNKDQGEVFARERNIKFLEVSAANGSNINAIFQYILQKYSEKMKKEGIESPTKTIKLTPKPKATKKEGGCC